MKTNEMTISQLRLRGHKALFDALGPAGFVRFMQQFVARGDYTKDRQRWLHEIDLSDLEARLERRAPRRKRKAV
jgi:hypothetical protein